MFEKFAARSPKARKAPVSPLETPKAAVKAAREGPAEAVKPGTDPVKKATDEKAARPKEVGGPSGPEPTRYGDWERKGICVDF